MPSTEIAAKVRAFIDATFLYSRPGYELGENESLLRSGVVDSMGVMEVIEFLGAEFGVMIDDADITEENLGTLSAIASYIGRVIGNERQIA